jgi:hypothetical protein
MIQQQLRDYSDDHQGSSCKGSSDTSLQLVNAVISSPTVATDAPSSSVVAAVSKRPSRSCTSLFSSPTVSAKADDSKRYG